MAVKQKKRRWPDEEKRSICFQTTVAGVSVAQVARRYAMNANLIFKWLKDERYAPDADAVPEEPEPVFLPVEVATSPVLALASAWVMIFRLGRLRAGLRKAVAALSRQRGPIDN